MSSRRETGKIMPYRQRILFLVKLLWEETDEDNTIGLGELYDCLETVYGQHPNHVSLHSDIQAINDSLFPVGGDGRDGWYRITKEVKTDEEA